MPMKVRYETVYGEVLSETRSGVFKQYIPDSLGNVVALMDETQAITDTFGYWPYGEVANRTGTTATALQYGGTRGYYSDSSNNNLPTFVRARYLDSVAGRWITPDPIGYRAGDANFFRYAGNGPVTYTDPTGLITPACIAAGLCLGGAGIGAIIACGRSPKGFANCMYCFCAKNPLVCGLIAATCLALLFACLPEFAPIIQKIISQFPKGGPIGQPAFGFGDGGDGGGGSGPCNSDDHMKICEPIWEACITFCDITSSRPRYCKIPGIGRWNVCCHNWCGNNFDLCLQGSPPKPWSCADDPDDPKPIPPGFKWTNPV